MADPEEPSPPPAHPPASVLPAELTAFDAVRYVLVSLFVGCVALVVLFLCVVLIGGLGADDY